MSSPVPPADHDALPPGSRFGELEIRRVIGVGGFGIVYLAYDHALERDVALKEYMPSSLASRGQGSQITVRSAAHAETYAVGLRSFVNEARLLARFDHPSMVRVYRFWEDNGTAYMVMPFLEGRTLRDARKAMSAAPDEGWIRSVLDPVLSAVDLLHREGVYHRDIAPDNILLLPEGRPMLLDFGAARRVISDRTQSLTAILKPSYAPIEQYAEMATLRQGPWTDLYAFGAVIHFLLFGVPPSPATARAVHDDLTTVAHANVPGVSPQFLAATAWALAVKPADRPQSVADFRAALDGRIVPPPIAAPMRDTGWEPTLQVGPGQSTATIPVARPATTGSPGATQPPRAATPMPPAPAPAARPAASRAPAPMPVERSGGGRGALVGGSIAAAVVVAAAAGWFVLGSKPSPTAAPPAAAASAPEPTAAPPVAATPAPAPAQAAAPAPAEAPAAAPAAVPAPVTTAPATAAAPAPAPAATPPAAAAPAPAPTATARPETTPRPAATTARTEPRPATPRNGDAGALQPRPAVTAAPPRDAAPEPPARPVAATADPSPSSTVPSPSSTVAAPNTAAATPARTPQPATAREACGSRVLIALAICMDRQCARPEYASGSDCRRYLEEKRRRDQQRGMPSY